MQIERLVRFLAGAVLHKPRTTALDLNTTARLLLNVLHVGSSMTNNTGTKIEAGDGLQINGDLLLGPFALRTC